MKYTVNGFSQKKAVELGLSAEDLLILRWFVDFQGSDKMLKFSTDDGSYAWVDYKHFLDDMPIVKCNKKNLAAKFQHLTDAGVLKHKSIKQGGTFSAYCFGSAYGELIASSDNPNSVGGVPKSGNPIPKLGNPLGCNQETPLPENSPTKINLLNYPSTKDQSIEKETKKKTASHDSFCGQTFSPEMQEALTDWLTYKSERHEGYKPTGLKMFMSQVANKTQSYEEKDIIQAIRDSMANNWKGVCWDRLKGLEIPEKPKERPIPQDIINYEEQNKQAMRNLLDGKGSWKDLIPE